jgi:hypothetical protein
MHSNVQVMGKIYQSSWVYRNDVIALDEGSTLFLKELTQILFGWWYRLSIKHSHLLKYKEDINILVMVVYLPFSIIITRICQ